jgi:hypothetical protein
MRSAPVRLHTRSYESSRVQEFAHHARSHALLVVVPARRDQQVVRAQGWATKAPLENLAAVRASVAQVAFQVSEESERALPVSAASGRAVQVSLSDLRIGSSLANLRDPRTAILSAKLVIQRRGNY